MQAVTFDRYEFASEFIFKLAQASGLGLLLMFLVNTFNPAKLNFEYLILTEILIIALVIWLTINYLEKFLQNPKINFAATVRILFGVILSAALIVWK